MLIALRKRVIKVKLRRWRRRFNPLKRSPPVSSNGTEIAATHLYHSPSSLNSSGFRSGRNSPRATASANTKA